MKKVRRVNLHDLLRQKSYDHAFLLTYAFSPGFFENYCLERFNSLKENGNISVLLDGAIYDSLLTTGADSGYGDFPAKANIRYLLHPIRIPGCFHPKVFLFANEKRGLLIIGSANLTRDGIRSERHRQEALQNASRFIGVLRELSLGGDDDALLQFLQYCDIPIITSLRLTGLRRARSQFAGDVQDMRQLGDRSLRQFFTLHEAVIGFTKRHLHRLRRHVKDGTASGIPNFMHILLAVAGLLETQMEKACVAFENQQGVLQSDQWHNFRKQADEYLNFFEEAISIFASEYMPQMISGYSKKAVLAGLGDDWNVFCRIVGEMMRLRDRIETARLEKLRIQAQSYQPIVPDYFNSILGGTKWRAYQSTITNLTEALERRIAA